MATHDCWTRLQEAGLSGASSTAGDSGLLWLSDSLAGIDTSDDLLLKETRTVVLARWVHSSHSRLVLDGRIETRAANARIALSVVLQGPSHSRDKQAGVFSCLAVSRARPTRRVLSACFKSCLLPPPNCRSFPRQTSHLLLPSLFVASRSVLDLVPAFASDHKYNWQPCLWIHCFVAQFPTVLRCFFPG